MSRSGRGRGGRKMGPDLSWDDEAIVLEQKKPEPLFPDIHISTPKPLTQVEINSVERFLLFKERVHNGPYYAVLETTSFTDEHGKVDHRAGFDPFTGMEKYSTKHERPKRSMPDLSGTEYSLELFPQELWRLLDPGKTHHLWKTIASTSKRKRKRAIITSDNEASDDSDVVVAASRRKRSSTKRKDDPTRPRGQKAGLEPEDDIPDIEQEEEEAEGEDDALQDTDFSESEEGGDDYDAEAAFDNGEGDDIDDGGFGDAEGGSYD